METNEKTMSSQESIKIISDMIKKTKINVSHSAFYLIFWGWLVTILSLSEYFITIFTDFENPWLVWLLSIVGVIVSMIYGFSKGSKQKVYTYAESIYMWVWMGFLTTATILVIFIGFLNKMAVVGPFILLVAAMAIFISGIVMKFKPLIWGGVSIWVFSVIGFFAGPYIGPLAIPAAVITGYLIPGYMLKKERPDNDTL